MGISAAGWLERDEFNEAAQVFRIEGGGDEFEVVEDAAYRTSQLVGVDDAAELLAHDLAASRLGEQIVVLSVEGPSEFGGPV